MEMFSLMFTATRGTEKDIKQLYADYSKEE